MTQQGRAAEALGTAIICSAIGGLASCLVLILVAPALAKVALAFGDPEYFALVVFGLSVVPSLGGKSTLKGLLSALMGLFLATIGVSVMTGLPRFTFGVGYLYSGIFLVLAAVSFITPFLRRRPGVLRSVAEAWQSNGRTQPVTREAGPAH